MNKHFLTDILLMEDLLDALAEKGYTVAELDDIYEQALEELGLVGEYYPEDDYEQYPED